MLKRDITYENFDGEMITETFYFNFTKTELVSLQIAYEEGLQEVLQRIIRTENQKGLVEMFQEIILAAYGIKSEDGKRFIKSDELRNAFSQTAAYDALFIELAQNDSSAAEFIRGIIPKDLVGELEQPSVVPAVIPPIPTQ